MKSNTVDLKREHEKEIIHFMIKIYCKGHKHGGTPLCDSCKDLSDYSLMRVDLCPHIEEKTFCSSCKTHCFSEERREQIRTVMRYSGPRMLLYNPAMFFKHVFRG